MVGYGKCCGACEGKLVLFSYRLGQEQRTQSDGAFEMKTCYEVLIQAQLWNYSCLVKPRIKLGTHSSRVSRFLP